MIHRSGNRYCCPLVAYVWNRELLLSHDSPLPQPAFSQPALCNIYIQYACIQFNFKRTIKTLCFETHFEFAFYIYYYKMALHFNRVIGYKGVDRTQNDLFLGKLYSIEFSKAAKNYALWNFFLIQVNVKPLQTLEIFVLFRLQWSTDCKTCYKYNLRKKAKASCKSQLL